MLEQNFGRLLRASKFANYQSSVPQMLMKTGGSEGTFGLKRTLALKKQAGVVHVQEIDSEYNQSKVADKSWAARRKAFLEELALRVGSGHSDPAKQQSLLHSKSAGIPQKTKIVGRFLGKVSGGYSIGIGGEVALLPVTEVPTGFNFSYSDLINRNAFLFTVKRASMGKDGRSDVIVSLL